MPLLANKRYCFFYLGHCSRSYWPFFVNKHQPEVILLFMDPVQGEESCDKSGFFQIPLLCEFFSILWFTNPDFCIHKGIKDTTCVIQSFNLEMLKSLPTWDQNGVQKRPKQVWMSDCQHTTSCLVISSSVHNYLNNMFRPIISTYLDINLKLHVTSFLQQFFATA